MGRYRVVCTNRGDTIVEAVSVAAALAVFRARPDAKGAIILGVQLGEDVSTFPLAGEETK